MSKEPQLRLNRRTGKYEAYFKMEVEPEFVRRAFQQAYADIAEHVDVLDPAQENAIRQRVGNAQSYFGKPHTRITAIEPTLIFEPSNGNLDIVAERIKAAQPPDGTPLIPRLPKHSRQLSLQAYVEIENRLWQQAKAVAPYRWVEALRTPLLALEASPKDRQYVSYIRTDEKHVLEALYIEWQEGRYQLTEEAAREQDAYASMMGNKLEEKIGAMAEVVNDMRHA